MIAKSANIKDLIPHREPFLFLDEVISATENEIVGQKTFEKEGPILEGSFEFVPGMIIVESMAQCGGAGLRLLTITSGLFGFASIDKAEFVNGASFGKPVKYIIKNIKVGSRVIKQSGIAYVDDAPVVEATWTCIKIG